MKKRISSIMMSLMLSAALVANPVYAKAMDVPTASSVTQTETKDSAETAEKKNAKEPNVKISIKTPQDKWHKDTAMVPVVVKDISKSKDFEIASIQAKIGQNGTWTDITEDQEVEISENCAIYVMVTDQNGKTYEKNRYITCFDFTAPTLNAAVNDGLLSIQTYDTASGIKAVYVNGYEFKKFTNGVLNIRLQKFDAGYQYFTIQAMDHAGNVSEVYKTQNPYYTDPSAEKDASKKNPAEQLPTTMQPTAPTNAVASVTQHVATDNNGNQIVSGSEGTKGDTKTDEKKGKEFYTIQTKNEKTFYLVVDRNGETENVYFLTEIGENDLLNVTTDNNETMPQNSAALESAIPTGEEALENNNDTSLEEMQETEELESGTEMEEEEIEEKEAGKDNPAVLYGVLGAGAVAVIAVAMFMKKKKKDEDFLDEEEDDEEEEEEFEEDEADSEDDFFDAKDEEDE